MIKRIKHIQKHSYQPECEYPGLYIGNLETIEGLTTSKMRYFLLFFVLSHIESLILIRSFEIAPTISKINKSVIPEGITTLRK